MKTIKNVFLLSLILFGCSPLKMVTDIKYDKPIEMPGKTKSELFGMSNEWMITQFSDARSIIQFSNLEVGTISGKYLMFYQPPDTYTIEISFYAIITIRVKDGKAQITIDPQGALPRSMLGIELYTMKQMEMELDRLMLSFEDYLKTYQEF